jgi:HSP20 family protein
MRNALDHWRSNSPWSVFNDMDRLMNRFVSPIWDDDSSTTMMGFNPACEVDEQDDHFLISLDLPGVSKDEVKVEVIDNRLVISGERKHEKKEGKGRSERYYGRFERSFALPTAIDADKIEARYENGVLELAVPKAESAKPRTIQIHSEKEGFLGRFLNKGKTVEGATNKTGSKDRLVS